jgi:DHA1 family bicyclomycin/chloramphenicol resistance-like MFS transporter
MAAWATKSLEWILVARFCQGLGAAGPRVVSMAMVRDLFSGREMARIVSIAMTIFILVPAIAPAMGHVIINAFGWRSIFGTFITFAVVLAIWMGTRYNESLAVEDRRPLRMGLMLDAIRQLLTHKIVRLSILIQTLMLAMLFATLILIQPIYDQIYNRGDTFPLWFGAVALFSGTSSILNAYVVTHFGMHRVVTLTLFIQICAGIFVLISMTLIPTISFQLFVFWQFCLFSQAGLTMGNLNAISMEPMGHIAGMAASVVGSISTLGGALIASPVSLLLSDTPAPLIISILCFGLCATYLMRQINQQITEN